MVLLHNAFKVRCPDAPEVPAITLPLPALLASPPTTPHLFPASLPPTSSVFVSWKVDVRRTSAHVWNVNLPALRVVVDVAAKLVSDHRSATPTASLPEGFLGEVGVDAKTAATSNSATPTSPLSLILSGADAFDGVDVPAEAETSRIDATPTAPRHLPPLPHGVIVLPVGVVAEVANTNRSATPTVHASLHTNFHQAVPLQTLTLPPDGAIWYSPILLLVSSRLLMLLSLTFLLPPPIPVWSS